MRTHVSTYEKFSAGIPSWENLHRFDSPQSALRGGTVPWIFHQMDQVRQLSCSHLQSYWNPRHHDREGTTYDGNLVHAVEHFHEGWSYQYLLAEILVRSADGYSKTLHERQEYNRQQISVCRSSCGIVADNNMRSRRGCSHERRRRQAPDRLLPASHAHGLRAMNLRIIIWTCRRAASAGD